MKNAISLQGLNKSFGPKQAVRDLHLDVPRGALYGIIGPNGAGKSTSLRMILSILFPDSGHIEVLGQDSALKAKDRIGYLPEERGVYRKMKVGEFLKFMAVLKGVGREEAKVRVAQWLERVGLGEVAKKRCEELSKGMQQKIQYIASVIHQPDLLILDEPFSGLDPVNMRLLKELILEENARGTTVLFSTHVMHQAEQVCEHIVMIHNGCKVLDDPLAAIRARHEPRALLFNPLDAQADVDAVLRTLPAIADIGFKEGRWHLGLREGHAIAEAVQAVSATLAPSHLEVQRPSLEDVFIEIATGGQRLETTEVAA